MRLLSTNVGVLLLAGALVACGDSTTAPSFAAGTYNATTFTTTGTSGQTNQLLAGSTLNITLSENGTTSGHLHVVASSAIPAFDADLAGTWTETNHVVHFTQPADTFVNDMAFTFGFDINGTPTLAGDANFGSTAVHLILTRTAQ